jgi:hypothetical protein
MKVVNGETQTFGFPFCNPDVRLNGCNSGVSSAVLAMESGR